MKLLEEVELVLTTDGEAIADGLDILVMDMAAGVVTELDMAGVVTDMAIADGQDILDILAMDMAGVVMELDMLAGDMDLQLTILHLQDLVFGPEVEVA